MSPDRLVIPPKRYRKETGAEKIREKILLQAVSSDKSRDAAPGIEEEPSGSQHPEKHGYHPHQSYIFFLI